ncbi:MAG: signal peptidase I [Candidatus Berkelbacteria bacterium]|nr:MAG: signal peptidase I [Candidatus Berkelbacteria bacterium]QQG51828.1 MAG: signal peptidase I [Candidatus Berkelbacteria bacterium]
MEGITVAGSRQAPFSERLYWVTGWVYDFSKVATIFLLVGLVVHYFFYTALIVRGKSMVPTFADGQILTVNKIAYVTGAPERGDVVAMFFPGETEKRFIKRIVALPGETISIKQGKTYINGVLLKEPYLKKSVITVPEMERTLVGGEYFVMGDNRGNSSDSRAWGPVPESFVIGKVMAKVGSL